jgi:hypothetical protein
VLFLEGMWTVLQPSKVCPETKPLKEDFAVSG